MEGQPPAPITVEQPIEARRPENAGSSFCKAFNRVQENAIRGGQPGRSTQGRRVRARVPRFAGALTGDALGSAVVG
jgi:hypothetical protein